MTKMVLFTLSVQSSALYIRTDGAGYYVGSSLDCAAINTAWSGKTTQVVATSSSTLDYNIHSLVLGSLASYSVSYPPTTSTAITGASISSLDNVAVLSSQISGNAVGANSAILTAVACPRTAGTYTATTRSYIIAVTDNTNGTPFFTKMVLVTLSIQSGVLYIKGDLSGYKAPVTGCADINTAWETRTTYTIALAQNGIGYGVHNIVLGVTEIAPTMISSAAPTTSAPSVAPSIAPSVSPSNAHIAMKVNSPAVFSVQIRNQFAFAAINSTGGVVTWGEHVSGGDSSTVAHLLVNVRQIVQSVGAFAALKKDGTVVIWGLRINVANCALLRNGVNVTTLIANKGAFAGITRTGGVVTCGQKEYGGSLQQNGYSVAQYLTSKVVSLVGTDGAFAALKSDGTVYAWGNKFAGGGVSTFTMGSLENVVQIVASQSAFAALKLDGSVVIWGASDTCGDMSSVINKLASNVQYLSAYKSGFLAYNSVLGVIAWSDYGSLTETVTDNVTGIAYTVTAASILKEDGSIVSWGDADFGSDMSLVTSTLHNITHVYSNGRAFAALNSTGGVNTWGETDSGGYYTHPSLSQGVVEIVSTRRAFAALKSDGSVVVWGHTLYGGYVNSTLAAYLTSGVKLLCANEVTFTAIKTDGTMVTWGNKMSIGSGGVLVDADVRYSTLFSC